MHPLPLALSIALLAGCATTVTPGPKTASGGWKEATTKQDNAEIEAEEARETAKRRAYAAAHPKEYARDVRAMERYMNNQPRNAYGCPGTQVPMTWAPWWGPNACAQRTW